MEVLDMKKLIFLVFFSLMSLLFSNEKKIKVYDCFLFLNELDILDIRLNELYDVVDYFVIVENPSTHSGNPKPLYFKENKQRFSKFLDKVIHVIGQKIEFAKDTWVRENSQRNDILLGLKNAKDDDVVIISDVDEILKKEKVREIKDYISKKNEPVRLNMKMYRYFLNRQDLIDSWQLAIAASCKDVRKYTPQYLRVEFAVKDNLKDAGWHFTSLGWIKQFSYKMDSWAHQEWNKKKNKNASRLLKKARKGKLVKIDSSYPKYVVENLSYFKKINFVDDNYPFFWNLKIFNKRQKALNNQKF